MTVRLRPAHRLHGSITVPGDKSISHRALILNAMASGNATVDGFLPSADCLSTMTCLRALGVEFNQQGNRVQVVSPGRDALRASADPLDCGNSGTSMRLLAGVAAGIDGLTILDGDASLRARPMARVLEPLAAMGAIVDGRAGATLAPISIRGGALRPFNDHLAVPSAQVKSAVLLAALAADGPSRIEERAPTRDHTEVMLAAMGAEIERHHAGEAHVITIDPGAPLHPVDLTVPADPSGAAYWLVAASLAADAEVHLPGVGVNPTRSGAMDVLITMGATIERRNERTVGGEAVADLTVRSARLRGVTIEGSLIPRAIDELPVLAVAAALADGVTEIRDAQELRVKESDRIASTAAMLRAFGIDVEERPDGMRIVGGGPMHGATVKSYGDHRLAMAAAVGALSATGESELDDGDVVGVSYPQFWQDLATITGVQSPA